MAGLEKKYLAIVNPASRSGRTAALLNDIDGLFAHLGSDVQIVSTTGPGHAEELAAAHASAFDVIIAVGGDGTVHEVSKGLLKAERGAAMAVIPAGTGNDFARMMGMQSEIEAAARQLSDAKVLNSDAGTIRFADNAGQQESHFINAVGIGFDGFAASLAPRYKHLPFNIGYLVTVLRALLSWRASSVSVSDTTLNEPISAKMFMITIGNAMDSGGGFRINPRASLVDGLLDACLVSEVSIMRALRLLPTAARGAHLEFPEVQYWQTPKLSIQTELPMPIHADGEMLTHTATQIEVEILRGALPICIPESTDL